MLHGGKVIADGNPAEVSADEAVQNAYLGGHVKPAVDDVPAEAMHDGPAQVEAGHER